MLKAGDRVIVAMPAKELTLSAAVRAFHGKKTRIIGERHYSQYGKKTYYLEECVSKYGKLYEFLEEWVLPLDVEGEGK